MKTHINLFSKKKQQQPIPVLAITLRSYGILYACICIVLSLISSGLFIFQSQKQQRIENEVANLQTFIKQNDKIQGNIVFFINKKEQLNTFLKDDNNFEMYYRLLSEILERSGTTAQLSSMSLTSNKSTDFVINVNSFDSSQKLLEYLESSQFVRYFTFLSMDSFSLSREDKLELKFRGQFLEETEQKNEPQS
jgi:hypothetical protein